MAKIKLITGLNVKGYDFTYQLGSVNMIVGNNGTGKTARLAALRLAILGHEPKLGTQGASTYQLAGATKNEMRVFMQTEIGNSEKRWTMKGGKVSANETLDDTFSRAIQDVPTVMLDSREFFGLKTSDSRSKFIFNTYKIGDGATSPTSLITKLKAITLEKQTDAHTEALQEIVDKVMDSARNRSRAVKEEQDYPLQQWLTEQHATVKEIGTVAKGTYTRMVQSVEATTQHQGAEQQAVFRPIETLKDEMAKLQSFGEQLAGELRELLRRQEQAVSKIKRRSEIQKELSLVTPCTSDEAKAAEADLAKARAQAEEHALLLGRLNAELTQMSKEIALDQKRQEQESAAKKELQSLHFDQSTYDFGLETIKAIEEATNAQSRTPELKVRLEAETQTLSLLERQYRETLTQISKIEETSDNVLKGSHCPTCTLEGDTWKAAYAKSTEGALNALNEKLGDIGKRTLESKAKRDKFEADLTTSESDDRKQAENRNRLAETRKKLADMEFHRNRIQELHAEITALNKDAHSTNDLTAKRYAIEHSIADAQKRRLELMKSIGEYTVTVNAWQTGVQLASRLDEIGEDAPVDYPALIQAVRTKQDERTNNNRTLELELQKATEAQQDELRKAQSNAEMEKAKARSEIAREALKVIQEFQKEVVDGVFATLIGRANSIVGNLLPAPLEYREGQIGWQRGNLFVTEKTFCGLEEVMTFVAFSLALSPDSPFKIIILDEMGMLSRANRLALVAQMHALAKAGTIDQFVGADCDEELYNSVDCVESINIIKT